MGGSNAVCPNGGPVDLMLCEGHALVLAKERNFFYTCATMTMAQDLQRSAEEKKTIEISFVYFFKE